MNHGDPALFEPPVRHLPDHTDALDFGPGAPNMSCRNLDTNQRAMVMAGVPKLRLGP